MNQNLTFFAGVLGLGAPELILVLAIVMMLFGAKRLPELAKGLGSSIREFKRASADTGESTLSTPTPTPVAAAQVAPVPVAAAEKTLATK